jgi:hypothetical protein
MNLTTLLPLSLLAVALAILIFVVTRSRKNFSEILLKQQVGVDLLGADVGSTGISSFGTVAPMGIAPQSTRMGMMRSDIFPPPEPEVPPTDQTDRLVIRETTMSMVVKNVIDAVKGIQSAAEQRGGFLISSHVSKPEEGGNGSISVRVPENKRSEALDEFRRMGFRVVDEQVSGRDVTDEYVDLDARLATLSKTKQKFEDIFDKATQIQDLLNVQREIINLQSQIDSVKGQQQYLSQSAKLSKITVFLSTDEFSLPYAPAEPWRPQAVFKLAVRSLVANLRNVGTFVIWIAVYAIIWGPIAGAVWVIRKRRGAS